VLNKVPHHLPELGHLEPVAPAILPRRAFHLLAGSIIPVLILFLPRGLMEWVLIAASIGAILVEAGRGLVPGVNDLAIRLVPLFKPKERYVITGSTFLILTATLVFFTFDKPIAVLSLMFLAVGDPMAALVGIWDPKLRVFGKSLIGTAAFIVSAVAVGLAVGQHPDIDLGWWFVPGAVAAGVAELLPLPVDDNIVIPLAGAGTMALLAML
jgi:dolichol kinase